MVLLEKIDIFINNLISMVGIYGPIVSCLLIIAESIIPIMPLSVFITINFINFGSIIGFLVSWIFTIIGCSLSFFLFQKYFQNFFEKRIRINKQINKFMKIIEKLKFQQLVLILAIPFTPAFIVNIAAGLSKMTYQKYLRALVISKIFLVYFWGYVGTNLLQSLTNPAALIKVIVLIIIAYLVSKLVNTKFNID